MLRKCAVCEQQKPWAEFRIVRNTGNYARDCNACYAARRTLREAAGNVPPGTQDRKQNDG